MNPETIMDGEEVKEMKKLIALLMTVMLFSSVFALPAMAVKQSYFTDGGYCKVSIDEKLLNKRGKQYAKVKLQTYNHRKETSGKVVVTMRDGYGNYIWSGVKKGGDTLKLGDDHSIYRIYVSVYEEPVQGFWAFLIRGKNADNRDKCVSWRFLNEKDCSIS